MPSNQRLSCRTAARSAGGMQEDNPRNQNNLNDNVRVVVRVRPMNSLETEKNSSNIIHLLDEHVLVFDPNIESSPSYFRGKRVKHRNIMAKKNRDLRFAFDHVFDGDTSQQYVYENTTRSIVDSVLNGFNASVFAYGATGAGKTHTMLGGPDSPGVIFLTMVELYQKIAAIKEDKVCDVTISYLEVYNETIRDLLVPSGILAVREDPQKGVLVNNLTVHKPKNAQDLFQMLEFGNHNRTQHPTDANQQSSRSHAVFQVFVRQKDRTANLSADVRVAKMSLIDLAGSERATVTTNRGARLREGANINKSLLALGNCINALADSKNKSQHVPYRNSKLTRLLKDSLGGNCKTVMIATISPSSLSYEDTYNTLRYANRTKDIKTSLKRNVVSVNFHVTQYTKIVNELRTEVAELKLKLQKREAEAMVNSQMAGGFIMPDENTMRFQLEVQKVFNIRASIRKEILELESSDRNLTAKIMRKHQLVERVQMIHGNSCLGEKTTAKFERTIAAAKSRQARLQERKSAVEQRGLENQHELVRLENQMRAGGDISPLLKETVKSLHLEIELKDNRRLVKHVKKFARYQENHIQSSERLITNLLSMVRQQFFLIKGSNIMTTEINDAFELIQKQVEGFREVAWADQSMSEDADPFERGECDINSLIDLPILSCATFSPRGCYTPKHRKQSKTPTTGRKGSPHSSTAHRNTPSSQSAKQVAETIENHPSRTVKPNSSSAASQNSNFTPQQRASKHTPHRRKAITPRSNIPTPSPSLIPQRVTPIATNTPQQRVPQNSTAEVKGSTVLIKSHHPKILTDMCIKSTAPSETIGSPNVIVPQKLDFEMEDVKPLVSSPGDQESMSSMNVNAQEDVTDVKESSGSDDSHCKSLRRSVSFGHLPGSDGGFLKRSPVTGQMMSYAEAANTPRTAAKPSASKRNPFAPISTNSPQYTNPSQEIMKLSSKQKRQPERMQRKESRVSRRDTFTMERSHPYHRRSVSQGDIGLRREGRTTNTLHKYGLPSMLEQRTGGKKSRGIPAYMTLTKSAANRKKEVMHKKRSSDKENQTSVSTVGPSRVMMANPHASSTLHNGPTDPHSSSTLHTGPSRQLFTAWRR